MNKQIFKYSSAIALLLDSSSAQQSPIGIGGPAPCVESWTAYCNEEGQELHFYHGFEAKDGDLVAVGGGDSMGGGMVVKMDRSCKPANKYTSQSI